jgi:hypothetical protein
MSMLPAVSMPIPLPAPRPRWLLVVMVLLSVGYAGLLAFAILGAIVSPMMFDSGDTPRNWAAFGFALIFPVAVSLGAAVSWSGFGFRRYALIPIGVALPIVYMVVFWFSFS